MKNLKKLFISFLLYLPLTIQAIEIPIYNPYENQVIGVCWVDNSSTNENNGIVQRNVVKPYTYILEFFNERKKSLGVGVLAGSVSHLLFHYVLQKPIKQFFTFLFTKKSATQQFKKTPWISRSTYFTHFIFDMVCAFVGYRTAQAFELDKKTGEQL